MVEEFLIRIDSGFPLQIQRPNNEKRVTKFNECFQIDKQLCIGCGLCAEVCPSDIIQLIRYQPQVIEKKISDCIRCGACMSVCGEDAIFIGRESAS